MAGLRTHYDNLKVARNAPSEVIAAAYRAISRRLHPDTNPHPDASKFMAIVNNSFAVLSDPARRAAHDHWIASQEVLQIKQPNEPAIQVRPRRSASVVLGILQRSWPLIVFAGFMLWAFLQPSEPPAKSDLPAYDRTALSEPSIEPAADPPTYVRPSTAPNGEPWPISASYVSGYKRLRTDGLSSLTVDNSSSDGDMFVKLVAIEADKTVPIRQFYLPRSSSFSMNSIRAGTYDLRYMDLTDGSLSRTESFELQQIEEPEGIRYSRSTVTLYKVANGNLQSHALNPEEF